MEIFLILFFLIFIFTALALAFRFLSRRDLKSANTMRLAYGIPAGKVIYSDLDRPAKALHSRLLGISGKPDYIVKGKGRSLIPVEIKSGRAEQPYKSHVMQLAAYCHLVEESYKRPVPYGIIVYSDGKQHMVNFDKSLRSELQATVGEMKRALQHECPPRRHSHKQKCRHCSFSGSCRHGLERNCL
jgi:CRISPR-associated exonuclease Cas4